MVHSHLTPDAQATSWSLLSLRVGVATRFGPHGEPSAIDKQPVDTPVYLSLNGFSTDVQGDPKHHGGPEKAVHHYAGDHYAIWQRELAEHDGVTCLSPGGFGENVSTLGLTEAIVAVGDIFSLGRAIVQVSQPRQPCWKLNIRFQVPDMAMRVQMSGRTGWYYRVLEPGLVQPDDVLRLTERLHPDWTLSRIMHVLYHDRLNIEDLTCLSQLSGLNPKMRQLAAQRVQRLTVEDWGRRLQGKV